VMEGWPGDVLSLLTLALHWEMRMTVMEGWPGDVLSLLSLYLLLSSALRSLSLSLYISVFLSLSSLLSPGFSSGSLCSLYVLGSVFPLLWPENGLSSRVRASRSWGTNASVSVRRTGAENLLPSVQFLFLRLVVFPVLLPLWKQRNGNVMEDWWASCFLPPLLVVSLVFPPQFFFSVFLSLFLFRFLPVFLFLPQSCSPASLPLPSFYKARDRLAL
jgi:hypothetical protein